MAWLVPSTASASPAPTIQVTARETSGHFTDTPPRGESAGDSFVFTDRLMQHGSRVGRDVVKCDVIRVTRRAFFGQCDATLTFRGRGDITVHGKLEFSANSGDTQVLAVTGGTGEFEGASGRFEVIDTPNKPGDLYHVHLLV